MGELCSKCFPRNCGCGYDDEVDESMKKSGWNDPNEDTGTNYMDDIWSDTRSKKTTSNSYSDTKIETDFENYTNDVWSSEPAQNSLEKEEDKNSGEETVEEKPEKETKITPPKKEK